ncbi:head maturation protease, ClpP-related [Carnimonas bestiolae]|uniref:head maturation protease, ClpP-related n=1 Tax=Carnimonas bestiolae TaxID=3402172 RepID=UPI003EDC7EEA
MKWYEMRAVVEKNAANGSDEQTAAEIIIDGVIGDDWFSDAGTDSAAFMRDVSALGDLDAINIKLNSPGGSVSDGVAIANYLHGHKATVTVTVMGQASSIASVITAAADNVVMGVGAWMLVHKPWTLAIGNADEMKAIALDLDIIQQSIMDVYNLRVPEEKRAAFEQLVNEETILTADECIEYGLADSKSVDIKAAASLRDFNAAARAAAIKLHDKAITPAQPPEQEPAVIASVDELRNAFPHLLGNAEKAAADAASAKALDTGKNEERTRVLDIINQCRAAGQSHLVERLVNNGLSGQDAGNYILDVAAGASDAAGISGLHNGLSDSANTETTIDSAGIYARRRKQGFTQ